MFYREVSLQASHYNFVIVLAGLKIYRKKNIIEFLIKRLAKISRSVLVGNKNDLIRFNTLQDKMQCTGGKNTS